MKGDMTENDRRFFSKQFSDLIKALAWRATQPAAADASSKSPQSDGFQPQYCPTCGQSMVANQDTELTRIPTSSTPKMAGDYSSIAKPGPTSS